MKESWEKTKTSNVLIHFSTESRHNTLPRTNVCILHFCKPRNMLHLVSYVSYQHFYYASHPMFRWHVHEFTENAAKHETTDGDGISTFCKRETVGYFWQDVGTFPSHVRGDRTRWARLPSSPEHNPSVFSVAKTKPDHGDRVVKTEEKQHFNSLNGKFQHILGLQTHSKCSKCKTSSTFLYLALLKKWS